MHGIEEKCTWDWIDRLKRRDFKEDLGADGKRFT